MLWKMEEITLAGACNACLEVLKYFVQPQYTENKNVWTNLLRVSFSACHTQQQICDWLEIGAAVWGRAALSCHTILPHLWHWWSACWSLLGDPTLQISSAGMQQKGTQHRKSGACRYGALAAEEQLPPLKAAPVIAMSQKSTFTWISARSNNSLGILDVLITFCREIKLHLNWL